MYYYAEKLQINVILRNYVHVKIKMKFALIKSIMSF